MLSARVSSNLAFVVVAILALAGSPSGAQSQMPNSQDKAAILKNYGRIPLHFEPNVGQADAQAKFISRGNGYAFFLTSSEAVLVLRQHGVAQRPARGKVDSQNLVELLDEPLWSDPAVEEKTSPQTVLRTRLLGANPNAMISADEELPGETNYFIGNDPKRWRTNIPSYAKVKYDGVYPGVDLVYYGNQAQLEYDLVLAPGANPKQIRLAISGEEISTQAGTSSRTPITLRVETNGDLVVACATREVRYLKPVVYQTAADGHKQLVAARFVLKSHNQVGFAVASYDRTKALVIDPTLIYSTYIAGATAGPYYYGYFGDQAAAIAVDSDGNAYIIGTTASGDFPITLGAYQTVCKPYGNGCVNNGAWQPGYGTAVFVSKLSPDGSSLVYSTYLGGSDTDGASGIAVDSSGNAYIAGWTNSPDFPVTQGAYQTVCSPELDQQGGFCGASAIVSKCGPQGYPDGFVTKLDTTGSALVYSTFVGGSLNDYLTGIAVDSAGEAYVSGFTLSSYTYGGLYYGCPSNSATASYGYPITPGGYYPGPLPIPIAGQPWPFGSPSAFTLPPVTTVSGFPFSDDHTPVFSKLSADGSTMLYSTYIGGGLGPILPGGQGWGDGQTYQGTLTQIATGITIDPIGDAYLTGYSNASDQCCTQYGGYQYTGFPTTPGVVQPHNATYCANSTGYCGYDAFVAKFDPTVSGTGSLIYSTNLGGPGDDNATSIAVDSGGNAYVTGTATQSAQNSSPTFPTTPGTLQPTCPGDCTRTYGWVTKLNSTATALDYSTYLSGTSAVNSPAGIKVDSTGNAYVAGQTTSSDFPQQNPLQGFVGPTDAFLSVLDPTASTLLFSTFLSGTNGGQTSGAAGIALDNSDNIYVTGSTTSSSFPTTTGAFQTTCSKCAMGSWGVFVSAISALQQAPTLESISVSPSSASISAGQTQQFSATGHFSDNSTQDLTASVTWSSSNTAVATISTQGLATGVAIGGPVTVTAALNSISGTAQLTVTVATLQSITVSPTTASVAAGLTQQFSATGHYSDNSTQDLTASVTWSSSNTSVATISNSVGSQGLATGVTAGGPVTITATQSSVSGTAQLTVTAAVLQSITVSPTTASVAAGLTQQFTATGHYSDSSTQTLTTSVTWSSSNASIATISNSAGSQGLATGVAAGGPVTITATQSSISGTAQLTVTGAVLQSITVSPTTASVAAGLTQQFTATGHYSDSSTQMLTTSVTWSSSNTSVATISNSVGSQGLATGVAAGGPVTITATQSSISGTAQLTVTAAVLQSITVSPTTASVAAGLTQQFTATGHYSDSSTQTLTTSVTWSSSNASIATISNSAGSQGLATGVTAGGPVTITATQSSISGTAQLTVTAAVLKSITISPTTASVAAGLTQPFTATGHYSDSSTQALTTSVTWSSSNASLATISNSAGSQGLATGVAAGGPVTITATQSLISGTAQLTVASPVLVSIAITPTNPSVPTGSTQQFAATGTYSNGSMQNITNSVTWASSNTGVGTINSSGLASALAAGTTSISAKQGNISNSTTMTVIKLQSITISPLNRSIFVGSTLQFSALGHYSDGSTRDLTSSAAWTSSKGSVATITSPGGLATGVAKGSTNIKAVAGGYSASTTLTVNAVTLTSITVTPSTAAIPLKGTQQFTATGNYNNGTTRDLTSLASWSAAPKGIASVNSTGLATDLKAGTATISAKYGMVTGSAALTAP